MRQTHKYSRLTLALASALLCGAAQAENITYPGATLESVSVGSKTYSNTLAPTSATAANNTVTVISLGSSAAPDFIFGGWHDTEKVSKNTLIIKEAVLAGTPIAGGMGLGETSYNTVDISSESRAATPDTVAVYGGYSHRKKIGVAQCVALF